MLPFTNAVRRSTRWRAAIPPPLEVALLVPFTHPRREPTGGGRAPPRHVAAYACAGEPLRVAHGFGANLGHVVPVVGQPYLVSGAEMGELIAEALANAQ